MSFIEDKLAELGKHGLQPGTAEVESDTAPAAPQAVEAPPNPALEELEALRRELAESKTQRRSDTVQRALIDAGIKQNLVDPSLAASLLKDHVRIGEDGQVEVLGDGGTVRLNASFTPMSLDEYMREFANARPYLVRSDLKGGAGSSPNQRYYTAPEPVNKYFGRGSDSGAANRLALTNKREYLRLRGIAKSQGLVD